jgi:NAD-dependent SIR2 family protein deacetylase
MNDESVLIVRAADLLRSARAAVAFTGAGISTPSGIPDFRSPGSGLWEERDPFEFASLSAFRYHPEKYSTPGSGRWPPAFTRLSPTPLTRPWRRWRPPADWRR